MYAFYGGDESLAEEEVSRRTVALTVNASKLTARVLAQALQTAARKIRQERQAHKTPYGKQTVRQLMGHGEATSSIPVDAPALFDRAARRWNVDYAFYQTEPGKYLLFFKSKQADAITACMSDYSRRVLKQSRSRRAPVLERLKRAQERARRQPQRERTKELTHEDR